MHYTSEYDWIGSRNSVRRGLACVVIAAMAPALAMAQRGGGFGGGRLPGLRREPGIEIPKPVNMLNLLIEHRQEVALSDSQFKQVISMKRTLDSTNAPQMRKLDSVSRLFRGGTPMFSEPNAARRDSIAEARNMIRDAVSLVNDNNAAARDQAYALLSGQQAIKAKAIEAQAEKALEDAKKADDAKRKP